MNISRRLQRNSEKSKASNEIIKSQVLSSLAMRRMVSSVLAMSFVMLPVVGIASNITDSSGAQLESVRNVYDIYAQRTNGSNGVNHFQKFQLTSGDTANMYFREYGGSATVDNLFNFVDSRIDINGTLNAIKNNNKIGGNLYFLSKEGMVVGSQGIINAGSLHVATPTNDAYNALKERAWNDNHLQNFTINAANLPVNPSGTITILGNINTVGNVNLRAAKIAVGKNISGEAVGSVQADGINKDAKIQTGVSDFAGLVNVSGIAGSVAVDAANADGNVVLSAYANAPTVEMKTSTGEYITDPKYYSVEASVDVYGTVKTNGASVGNVDITATAEAGTSRYEAFDQHAENAVSADFINGHASTHANITIGGTVDGNEVNVAAKATNVFVNGASPSDAQKTIVTSSDNKVLSILGMTAETFCLYADDIFIANLENEAKVDVLEGAKINARSNAKATTNPDDKKVTEHNALSITADSTLATSLGNTNAAYKLYDIVPGLGAMPAVGVMVLSTDNNAEVNIAGKVEAVGDSKINANAKTIAELKAGVGTDCFYNAQTNLVAAAVGVTNLKNNSKVNIKDNIDVKEGTLDIKANTNTDVSTTASFSNVEDAIAIVSVNVTNVDSDANVLITADSIKAGSDLSINANNNIGKNSIVAKSSIGPSWMGSITGAPKQEVKKAIGNFVQAIGDKITGKSEASGVLSFFKDIGNKLSAGASVVALNESTNANVTIGKGVHLDANEGNLTIGATNKISDYKVIASAALNNRNKKDEVTTNMVDVGVIYADIDNKASVVIDCQETADKDIPNFNGKNVTIKAENLAEYNRIKKLTQGFQNSWKAFVEEFKNSQPSEEEQSAFEKLQAAANKLDAELEKMYQESLNKGKADNQGNSIGGTQEGLQISNELLEAQDEMQKASESFLSTVIKKGKRLGAVSTGFISSMTAYTDMDSYFNFHSSATVASSKAEGKQPEFGFSGSVNYLESNNNAAVLIGQNNVIKAKEKVDIEAHTKHEEFSAFGVVLGSVSGGTKNAIGASVGVNLNNYNTLVAIGKNVDITGHDIDIITKNEVMHNTLTLPISMAGDNAANASVNVITGTSNSIVSIDDEANLKAENNGTIDIVSANNSIVTNVIGNVAITSKNSAGASVGLNIYDVNSIVNIADNGVDKDDDTNAIIQDAVYNALLDNTASINNLFDEYKRIDDSNSDTGYRVEKTQEAANAENALALKTTAMKESLLGIKTNGVKKGDITANAFNANSMNSSVINAITVTAGMSRQGEKSFLGKAADFVNNTGDKVRSGLLSVTSILTNKINAKANSISGAAGEQGGGAAGDVAGGAGLAGNEEDANSFTLTAAATVSMNQVEGSTLTNIDGVNINLEGNKSKLSTSAVDSSFIGAFGGSAAISLMSGKKGDAGTSAGFAAVATANTVSTSAISKISNSNITGAEDISNEAIKDGVIIAASAAAGAQTVKDGGKAFAFNGATNINIIDNNLQAIIENTDVNNSEDTSKNNVKTNLSNRTLDDAIQVAGGIEMGLQIGGDKSVGVGGNVALNMLTNNAKASIIGGNLKNMGNITNSALNDITQIGAAVGLSVSTSSESSYSFNGAAVYNGITNTSNATIEGGADITADSLDMNASTASLKLNNYVDALETIGIDADGSSYIDASKTSAGKNDDVWNESGSNNNVIITTAVNVTASSGAGKGGAVSAAIGITDITNNFTADVDNSRITITKDKLDVNAKSDSLMVNVAAGGAGSKNSLTGAGSVALQSLNNTTSAGIKNGSNIIADNVKVKAENDSLAVNVAGTISVGLSTGASAGIGMAVGVNELNNTTGAYITGSNMSAYDDKGLVIDVNAHNESDVYAIGFAGGGGKNTVTANGAVIVNTGTNSTEAIIDGGDTTKKLENVKKLDVVAEDDTNTMAVVGEASISVGSNHIVSVGGTASVNQIGNDDKKQKLAAKVNKVDITTVGHDKFNIAANDKSSLTTIAIASGLSSGKVAVNGAVSRSLINRELEASMDNVSIEKADNDSNGIDLNVATDHDSNIVSNASIATVTYGDEFSLALGAGVTVNNINQNANAKISASNLTLNNVNVSANSTPNILSTSVGVGANAGLAGASATGSVVTNFIDNNVKATIDKNSEIIAENNVGVVATSDELISNYIGAVNVNIGNGAAVGASVAVNKITGDTIASIEGENTYIQANAKGDSFTVKDTITEDDLAGDEIASSDLFDGYESLEASRKDSTYSGILVDASSTHTIKSFLINGSLNAGVGASVAGNVNVNLFGGNTKASVSDAILLSKKDVDVIAKDYSNAYSLVGGLALGFTGASVGLASDTNTMERLTSATISANPTQKAIIEGENVKVAAEAMQGISSLNLGVSAAVIGAGVSNATSVAIVKNNTIADVSNAQLNRLSGLDVNANHLDKISSLNVAVGAAGKGAGFGIGVGVVKDSSSTVANVNNTRVDYNTDRNKLSETNIVATNTNKLNMNSSNAGVGIIGAGITAGVNVVNINSEVATNVKNSQFGNFSFKAGNVNIASENNLDFEQFSGTLGAGFAGIGVGVEVSTIDSQVTTNVDNKSSIYAEGDISITAKEERNVDQMAINAAAGAIAGGANVMVTTIGQKVDDFYEIDKDANDQSGADGLELGKIYKEAQDAVNNNGLKREQTNGALTEEQIKENAKVTLGKGADIKTSAVMANIQNAILVAGNKVNVEATETTNVNMKPISASLGGVSLSGTVGILNNFGNTHVGVINSNITANKDLSITSQRLGASEMEIYQGHGALFAINAAVGNIKSAGVNDIVIDNRDAGKCTLESEEGSIVIDAKDASTSKTKIFGTTVSGAGASLLFGSVENSATVNVKVDNNTLNAKNEVNITAERDAGVDEDGNKKISALVEIDAYNVGAAINGAGIDADVKETGSVTVDIGKTNKNKFEAENAINISALNNPYIKATTGNYGGSLGASISITVANTSLGTDEEHLKSEVNIGEDNTFIVGTAEKTGEINFKAATDAKQESIMSAMNFAGLVGVQGNIGSANVYSDVNVNVAKNNIYKNKITDSPDKEDIKRVNFNVKAINDITQEYTAKGVNVGLLAASGVNNAVGISRLQTAINLQGSDNQNVINSIKDMNVLANSIVDIKGIADGNGGGLLDINLGEKSASIDNDYASDTKVTMGGEWFVDNELDVLATNNGKLDLAIEAVRGSAIGYNGTSIDNKIKEEANVILENADITTLNKQEYTANNTIDYDANMSAATYNLVGGGSNYIKDINVFTAKVDNKNSKLETLASGADIIQEAFTSGTMDIINKISTGGSVNGAGAYSEHNNTYNNTVAVDGNSELVTVGEEANITLSTSDNTTLDFKTYSNDQGGLAGAAITRVNNNLTRNNTIDVKAGSDSKNNLLSTNNVNLLAGMDRVGNASKLDLTVRSEAYNNTMIPFSTSPKLNNSLKQNNKINVAGNVTSISDTNLYAGKGNTSVYENAQEIKIVSAHADSHMASTIFGETIKNETYGNKVTIDGNITAGQHNNLDITIDGTEPELINPVYNNGELVDGELDFGSFIITNNSDWYYFHDIEDYVNVYEKQNPYLEAYEHLRSNLLSYSEGSAAYNNLQNEINSLLEQMRKQGFAKRNDEGQWHVLSSQNLLGVSLPDIVASGGNINITAGDLTGTGNLTAKGSPQVNITNNSTLFLDINNIYMDNPGGTIAYNGQDLNSSNSNNKFTGAVHAEDTGKKPILNITSNYTPNGKDYTWADAGIGVSGTISSPTGAVNITNKNFNIEITGEVNAKEMHLTANHGAVTIKGDGNKVLTSVGGDPVAKYQYNEQVAMMIQEWIGRQAMNNAKGSKSFKTFEDYRNWLITQVGVPVALLDKLDAQEKAGSSGIVAGDDIYIDAVNVNVNGLVQSGYGEYNAKLDSETYAINKNNINATWVSSGRPQLSDNDVLGKDKYLISGGEMVWNDKTNCYDYGVAIYYNPFTGNLITEQVTPRGGNITIKGNISSSGDGRILALDGVPNINIDTRLSSSNLIVNTIKNNDIHGIVTIIDTNKAVDGNALITEYKNGYYRSYYDAGRYLTESEKTPWILNNGEQVYNPKAGTQYSWAGGGSGITRKKYTYTENFALWGAIKYWKTDELLANKKSEMTITNVEGTTVDSMDPTSFISQGAPTDNLLTINWTSFGDGNIKYTKTETTREYAGGGACVVFGGFGKDYYTFYSTEGQNVNSVTNLKADNPITIDFLNNNKNGDISITGKKDIIINGEITNASTIDNQGNYSGVGSVSIKSLYGSVKNNDFIILDEDAGDIDNIFDAYINTDNLKVDAENDVFLLHKAIGNTANIDIISRDKSGDIALFSDKGDLNIKRLDANYGNELTDTSGSVILFADGNISSTSNDTAVKGRYVLLYSENGGIGSGVDKPLQIVSNDGLYGNVTAIAKESIYLQENNGDMHINLIESEAGNVVLNVKDGSFINDTEDIFGSSVNEDRVNEWISMGLISADDLDDEKTHAANQAKQEKLDALTGQMRVLADCLEVDSTNDKLTFYMNLADTFAQDEKMLQSTAVYKEALANAKSDADITAANEAYANAKAEFFAQKNNFEDADFSQQEMNVIMAYAEAKASDNYGWSKNELIYAIQDSIINSAPGSNVTNYDTANVIGHDIVMTANKGGIGRDGVENVIAYADLNKTENLKLLSQAQAGELTWDDDNNQLIFRPQQAVVVENTSSDGKLIVEGRDNVYIANLTDAVLYLDTINTNGDLKLLTGHGMQVRFEDTVLRGNNITLYAGDGAIGNADSNMLIDSSGVVEANSKQDIYLKHVGDNTMNLQAIAAGGNIYLQAANGMEMTTETGKDMGYLRADGGYVSLNAKNGNIGTADDGIRVLNNGAVLDVTAENGNAYVHGSQGNKALVLGNVTADNFGFASETTGVQLGREEETGDEPVSAVTGNITVKDHATFEAFGNIVLDNGTVTANTLNIDTQASILQNAQAGGITANKVVLTSAEQQNLASTNNNIGTFEVHNAEGVENIAGNISYVNSKVGDVTIAFDGVSVDGNFTYKNLANNKDNTLHIDTVGENSEANSFTGDVTINIDSAIVNDAEIEADDITLTSQGSIDNSKKLTATGNVRLTSNGDLTNEDEIKGNNVYLYIKGGNNSNEKIKADGEIVIFADAENKTNVGNITNNDLLEAVSGIEVRTLKGDITNEGLKAYSVAVSTGKGIITNNKPIEATNVEIEASDGYINNKAIAATGDVVISTTKGVIINSEKISGKNINITTNEGSIYNDALSATNNLVIEANIKGDIENSGVINATNVTITAKEGDITNKAITATNNVVITDTKGNITNHEAISGNNISISTDEGNVENAEITAENDVNITNATGNITNYGEISCNNISINTNEGYIGNTEITAENDVNITNATGNITNHEAISGNNISISTNEGNIKNFGSINGNNISISTSEGDILNRELVALKDIEVTTEAGDITNKSPITAENVRVTVETGDIANLRTINATNNVVITNTTGSILNDQAINANNISISTNEGVISNAELNALKDVVIEATTSDVTNNGAISGEDVSVTVVTGNIANIGAIGATNDVVISNTNGNITNNAITAGNDVSIETEIGSITNNQAISGNNISISTNEGDIENAELNALKDVVIATEIGDVTNNGAISGENVNVTTAVGAIANIGTIGATNNVVISNTNGNITNNAITAGNDVTVTTETGNVTNNGAISGNNISIATNEGVISNATLTAENNVTISNVNGNITNSEAISGTNVSISTDEGNIENAELTALKDVVIETETGDVTNNGAISGENVSVTTAAGAIANVGAIEATNDVTITNTNGNITNNAITAGNDVTVTTETGNVTNNGAISGNNISIATNDGVISNAEITALKDVVIATEIGDVTNNGAISGENVSVTTAAGAIANIGAIGATNNVVISNTNGNITNNAITAGNDVSIETEIGNITNSEAINGNNISISTDEGNIENAELNALKDVVIEITTGDVTNNCAITGENVSVTTAAGNIVNVGAIEATNDVTITNTNGNITNNAITAGNNVTVTTETGNVTNNGAISGNNISIATNEGTISNATLTAKNDVSISNLTGSITNSEAISGNNISISTNEGNVENAELAALKDVVIETTTGEVTNNGAITAENVSVTSVTGNIANIGAIGATNDVIISNTNGNITNNAITAGNDVTVTTETGDITNNQAISGNSISIATNEGTISNAALTAENNVTIANVKGDISNNEAVSGNNISIATNEGTISMQLLLLRTM